MLKEELKLFNHYLHERFEDLKCPFDLKRAMSYSLFSGGKQIRPMLVLAVASLPKTEDVTKVFPLAMAIEMIHTYSLIHDDLPSMDNDDMRRGKPSNHRAFDEATAILAGDGLLSQSFEILSELEIDPTVLVKIIKFFAKAIGCNGMVGGQILDINLRDVKGESMTLEQLQYIHYKKTGKLFELSLIASAKILSLPEDALQIIDNLAKELGILFQAVDDLNDCSSDNGKTQGIDAINGQFTYLSLFTKDQLQDDIDQRYQAAYDHIMALEQLGYDGKSFHHILAKIAKRA